MNLLKIFDANVYVRMYTDKVLLEEKCFENLIEASYEGYKPAVIPRTYKYWAVIVESIKGKVTVYNKKTIDFPKVISIPKGEQYLYIAITDRNGNLIEDYISKMKAEFTFYKGETPSLSRDCFRIEEKILT